MMWRPFLIILVSILLVIAGSLAWMWTRPHPPLRIGFNAWPGYEFLYLAQERGFFRDAGVAVTLVEFNSLADVRLAYERGQIDGLGTTVVEVLQARHNAKRNLQVINVIDYSAGADEILLRQGRSDLRGARVGVEVGSLGIYVLVRALEKRGLTLADITAVNLGQLSMQEAFNKNEIDALVTYPPISISTKKTGNVISVFNTTEIPGEVVDVIAIDEETVNHRSGEVKLLVDAFYRAQEFARQETATAMSIMAARERISPEDFTAALTDGVKLLSRSEQADFLRPGGKLQNVVDATDRIMRASGQLSGPDRRAGIFTDRFADLLDR
jgi:NitT/TauT family transport system substrate-binding protein